MRLDTLHEDAKRLLAISTELLEAAGVDVPAKRYVAGGTLAWDMASLTVYVGPVYLGEPGRPQVTSAWPNAIRWVAPFYIQLLRDSEATTPGFNNQRSPDIKQLEAEGLVMTNDLVALSNLAVQLRTQFVQRSDAVGIGSTTPLGPEGSMVGARTEIHFTLSG